MSAPEVTGSWHWDDTYTRAYAQTTDPRVLAVIERDSDAQSPDGDCYAPAFFAEPHTGWGRGPDPIGVTTGDALEILNAFRRADDQGWSADTVDRYLDIFHGAAVRVIPTGRYRNDVPVVILDTPDWRAVCGITGPPGREHLDGTRDDILAYLNGDVFGVGYATRPARVMFDTEPIDLDDYNIEIQCWGFYGETYAQESAAAFDYGAPELPPMLEIPA